MVLLVAFHLAIKKSLLVFAALQFATNPANASPHPIVTAKAELPKRLENIARQAQPSGCYECADTSWSIESFCTSEGALSSVVSLLNNQPASESFQPSAFCSGFLQPWSFSYTDTTTTGPTITKTSTIHTSTSTTTTDTSFPTSTVYCPAPSPSMSCGLEGYRNHIDLIPDEGDSHYVADQVACQQLCLSRENCKSFLSLPHGPDAISPNCYLFWVPLAGHIYEEKGVGEWYYDRDCSAFLPQGCPSFAATTAPAGITPAPALHAIPRADIQRRDYTFPDFLSDVYPGYWQFACSCIITSASPGIADPQKNIHVLNSFKSTTSTETDVKTYFETPHLTTVTRTIL